MTGVMAAEKISFAIQEYITFYNKIKWKYNNNK